MSDPMHQFELSIAVLPEDIDEQGHVNNVVFVRWIQDIAIAHWRAAAPEEDRKKLGWVVVRHEIDYKRQAFLGDGIIARTWIGTAARRAFDRHTEILRASDRKVLASSRTVWCPIDLATGKPTDVNDEVRRRFSVNPPPAG